MSSEITPSVSVDEDHGDQSRELLISIRETDPPYECSIYQVPNRLRMVNEKAYTPQFVSIGPLHHGKEELAGMEKRKPSYLIHFLKRTSLTKQDFLRYIKCNEQYIRNCYTESSKLESPDFVTMILYDAIFILELFVRKHKHETDFILDKSIMYMGISMDIALLENQLPYFVLDELCKLAFDNLHDKYPSFKLLCDEFFQVLWIGSISIETEKVLHFTDWVRCAFLQNYPSKDHQKGYITKIPNAVKLYGSGVKFKRLDVPDCLFDIRLEEQKQRISCFKVKELKLPFLLVDDNTEPLLRNIMALEQLHYSNDAWICSYVKLLDYLIETEEDVDLLHGKGIIDNCLGDNASVANIFNKICNEISLTESCYCIIAKELKAHYRNPWNHSKAKLSSVYFNDLWTGTATVAAIVLLLLTVTQTVFSIL